MAPFIIVTIVGLLVIYGVCRWAAVRGTMAGLNW